MGGSLKARAALSGALVLGIVVVGASPAFAAEAENDTFTVSRFGPTTVEAPGVLANDDFDADDDTAALDCGDGEVGTVACAEDGGFTYTPDPAALLADGDSFTYTITDDDGGDSATVTLNFEEPAILIQDDTTSCQAGSACTVSVLDNDTGGELMTVTNVQPDGDPQGTFTFNEGGDFSYTPNAEHPGGAVTFTYEVEIEISPELQGAVGVAQIPVPETGTITATVTPAQQPTTTTTEATTTTQSGRSRQTTTTRSGRTTTSAPRVARTGGDDPSTLGPIAIGLIGAGALALATRRKLLRAAQR